MAKAGNKMNESSVESKEMMDEWRIDRGAKQLWNNNEKQNERRGERVWCVVRSLLC